MHSRPLFCFISIFSAVSALGADPSWFLDENLSSNTGFSSSPEYLSADLPSDLDFGTGLTTLSTDPYSTDISSNNDLLWNTDPDSSNNLFTLDSSLVVADCSLSENFPTIGKKSRRRRADGPNSCTSNGGVNSAVNSDVGNELDLPTKIFSPDGLDELDRAITGPQKPQNSDCVQITQGLLPIGVCSSGQIQDILVVDALTVAGIQFASLTLRHATICDRVCCFDKLGVSSLAESLASERTEEEVRAAAEGEGGGRKFFTRRIYFVAGRKVGAPGEHWKVSRGYFRPRGGREQGAG